MTVTLNPSLDRTLEVARFERGSVLRTSMPTRQAGGKGVNVSRALTANGVPNIAVVPVGGAEGAELIGLLEADGVDSRAVPIAGRTRSNITVAESDGVVTKLNEPGPVISDDELAVLTAAVVGSVSVGDWVVVSGTVPSGFSPARFAAFTAGLTDHGVHVAVDTSGGALVASLASGPRLIKPNRGELSEIAGRSLDSIADVVAAAQDVRAAGVEIVLVSLGADGAVFVGPDTVVVGESHLSSPRNTVGAGDCFLAGFLAKFSVNETDVNAAMLEALAWGASAAAMPGTSVPDPGDITRTNVQLVWQPDLDRPLLARQ